jgi:plasmid stability protein
LNIRGNCRPKSPQNGHIRHQSASRANGHHENLVRIGFCLRDEAGRAKVQDSGQLTEGGTMSELRIRDIDEDVISELRARAKRHGRTLGEEVRVVLKDEVKRHRLDAARRLLKLRESIRAESGETPDSTAYIRQQRDLRG